MVAVVVGTGGQAVAADGWAQTTRVVCDDGAARADIDLTNGRPVPATAHVGTHTVPAGPGANATVSLRDPVGTVTAELVWDDGRTETFHLDVPTIDCAPAVTVPATTTTVPAPPPPPTVPLAPTSTTPPLSVPETDTTVPATTGPQPPVSAPVAGGNSISDDVPTQIIPPAVVHAPTPTPAGTLPATGLSWHGAGLGALLVGVGVWLRSVGRRGR